MAGTTRHGCMSGPPLTEIVLDLGNSCMCYGCREKIFSVLNKLDGVKVLGYNSDENQIKVIGTVDPDFVLKKICKVKKHAKVSALTRQLPRPGNHTEIMQPPPQPSGQGHGMCSRSHYHQPPLPQTNCCGNEQPQMQPLYCMSSACHCPLMQPMYCKEPPPSSACHCPPPELDHQQPNNQLDYFLHGGSSPLVPLNANNMDILDQLAKIPNLKHVELINEKGIKLGFKSGQVGSFHPVPCMEVDPGYDHDALPHHHHPPPRYISSFSDEDPNGCAIM